MNSSLSPCGDSGERLRQDHELPRAITGWKWRYHHLGIPSKVERSGEVYLEHLGIHVAGFDTSPFGIEWMRFDPDCRIPELIQTVPHLAFEVDDLQQALEGKEILVAPNSPTQGVRVAMIVHDGAPVELMEFKRTVLETA